MHTDLDVTLDKMTVSPDLSDRMTSPKDLLRRPTNSEGKRRNRQVRVQLSVYGTPRLTPSKVSHLPPRNNLQLITTMHSPPLGKQARSTHSPLYPASFSNTKSKRSVHYRERASPNGSHIVYGDSEQQRTRNWILCRYMRGRARRRHSRTDCQDRTALVTRKDCKYHNVPTPL
jgi:hypothetical protein